MVLDDATTACVSDDQVSAIVTTCGAARRDDLARQFLERYRRDGARAIADVPLEHAVAIVDARARRIVLATDRFACCPLAYAQHDGGFAFSDRADAIAPADRAIAPQALLDYLFHHVIPAPRTVFAGVQRLAGGSRLVFENGKASVQRWWMPRFDEPRGGDFAALRGEFLGLLEQAVARRARGKFGCFLSGGTDSSTVAGMIGKVTGTPAHSYSMGFDAAGYDEMEYARIAARAYGTHHHEYYVTPGDLLEAIPAVARQYDQPFGNSSAAAAYLCARRARADGLDLLLAGDGGDELFGGNARYALQRLFGIYGAVPAPLRKALEAVFVDTPLRRVPLVRKVGGYMEYARVPLPKRLQYYNLLHHLGLANVLEADFLAGVSVAALDDEAAATYASASAGAGVLVNRLLAFDWKYTLEDNDLPKVVGTAAQAGLGVSFPLLDDALVDFSMRLPPGMKLKGFKLRWFFKEALRGFLPDEIITKKKHGFGLPFGVWATQHRALREFALDSVATLKGRGIVRPAFIDELLSRRLAEHPGFYGEAVWILMMLEQWFGLQPKRVEPLASVPFTVGSSTPGAASISV